MGLLLTAACSVLALHGSSDADGVRAVDTGGHRQSAALLHSPFTEESAARGLVYSTTQAGQFGDGVAFINLDGDRDADVVATGATNGVVGLFENVGGTFIDRSAGSGIPPVFKATGVVAADYDRDGDLDLYISAGYDTFNPPADPTAPNYLLRNDGNWQFTDVTAQAGVADDGPGYSAAWGDYDNDGWLDLYLSNRFAPNRMFHSLGDGTFEEIAVSLGVDRGDDPTFQSSFIDYDRDGDLDLYVANDKGTCTPISNHLFENVGGSFVEVTEASGTEACVWSMSIAIGDFDNNLYDDMYVTNLPHGNALLMNNGDGTFDHDEVAAGVASYTTGWGAVFFDYDNDGFLDLYVCNVIAPNRLYRHTGVWPCDDVSDILHVSDAGESYVVSSADIDDDGDLDLLVQNLGDSLRLYINHEGEKRDWAKFDVYGTGPIRHGIGTIVDVETHGQWRTRQLVAGCNYLNQNELILHFGLGDAEVMNQIEVQWPGGIQRTLSNLPTNETWTLYPPDRLGDGDHDGDRDPEDFGIYANCHDRAVQPACEMMDFDGNGTVDVADYAAFLAAYEGTPADCNSNGQIDFDEILADGRLDINGDGELDSCECPLDLTGDNQVDAADLAILLGAWGLAPAHPADYTGDGTINAADLAMLLGAWGC